MSPIDPPPGVRGMTEWRPELFNTTALIPVLSVQSTQIGNIRKALDKYLLKMNNMKPVQESEHCSERKYLLLNPELVSSYRDIDKELRDGDEVSREHFSVKRYDLTCDNWTPHELLKSILPRDEEGVSGFSTIGHIVHLNLRQHLEEYKAVIGQV